MSSPPPSSDGEQLEEFTPVTHKKFKPRAAKHRKGGKARPKERTLVERLASRRVGLDNSGYLLLCQKLLLDALEKREGEGACPTPACVVCLGLGSVAESSKSQDQYILLQELMRDLAASLGGERAVMYDPAFTNADLSLFSTDGLDVILQEHSLAFERTTLLYMPHCPRSLFDDLFRKNWSVDQLSRLVILGNRLDMYDDPAHPSASSSAKAPYIVKLVPLFTILPLPPDEQHFDIFNDLALQWIPESTLRAQNEDFWEFRGEPLGNSATGKGTKLEGLRVDPLELVAIA